MTLREWAGGGWGDQQYDYAIHHSAWGTFNYETLSEQDETEMLTLNVAGQDDVNHGGYGSEEKPARYEWPTCIIHRKREHTLTIGGRLLEKVTESHPTVSRLLK